jgi:hypothetical protein
MSTGGFMKLGSKIISVAAAAALVAGAGAMAASPATAAHKKPFTGKTIIDFKPEVVVELVKAGIGIEATLPATFVTTPKVMLGFPVTGVKGNGVSHSGSVTFKSTGNPAGVTGANPQVTLNDDKTASVSITVAGIPDPVTVFTIKHNGVKYSQWKIDKSHTKWVVKRTLALRGAVHLAPGADGLLNAALVTKVFTPDMGLGASRTTITEIQNCKSNTVKGCKRS